MKKHLYRILTLVFGLAATCSTSLASLDDLPFSAQHRIDLLRVCFSDQLDCKVVSRTNLQGETEVITLVGESHLQDKEALELGKTLLDHYEKVGRERLWENYGPKKKWLFKKLISNNSLMLHYWLRSSNDFNVEEGHIRESESTDPLRSKLSEAIMPTLYLGYTASRIYDLAYSTDPASPMDVASQELKNMIFFAVGTDQLRRIAQATQRYFESEKSQEESLSERENFMSENLIRAISTSKTHSIGVVTGAVHLSGIVKRLEKAGFVNRAKDLLNEYELLRSKDILMDGTVPRNLLDPFDSFHPDVREYLQQTHSD